LLDPAIAEKGYLTTYAPIVAGKTYGFKVTARNSVGSSDFSAILLVLAAKLPDAPVSVINVPSITTGYQIGITWSDGEYNGGSPVLDYTISYAEENTP
jgi:hypothetical protein